MESIRDKIGLDCFHYFCKKAKCQTFDEFMKLHKEYFENINTSDERELVFIQHMNMFIDKGVIIECAEMGHNKNLTDYSYSYLSVYIPRKYEQSVIDYAEENREYHVYIIDIESEKIHKRKEISKGVDIDKEERKPLPVAFMGSSYMNIMLLQYPTNGIVYLPDKVFQYITKEYISVKIRYYVPGEKSTHVVSCLRAILGEE